ncbi:MAG: tetratricopeptide repeat protein, partial [Candidatus Aminicenantes bacterium]
IDNYSLVKIMADPGGFFSVHYAVEPEKLSIYSYEETYSVNLEIYGKISDLNGKTVYQFQKKAPLEFTQEQLPELKKKRFSLQDAFPLISGHYRFDLLVKNTVSKEFTSLEKDITIPQSPASLHLSPLILSPKVRTYEPQREGQRPFQFGSLQLYPPAQKNFTLSDSLYVYFQMNGLNKELKERGAVDFSIFKFQETEKVKTLTRKIKEMGSKTECLQKFSLQNFRPGEYTIRVSVLDKNMNEVLHEQENFYISLTASIPRAWSLSEVNPPSDDPSYSSLLGDQYLNKGEMDKALALLEKAYRKRPQSLKYALAYSKANYILGEHQKVKQVLMPFSSQAEKESAVYFYLGKSSQKLGQFEEAISYYKQYLSHFGTHLGILNSIGDCYYQSGDKEEALRAWERSLEIDPKQEEIKKRVDSLKKPQSQKIGL